MLPEFKKRYYRHLDHPVNEAFATKAGKPEFVARHSFTPLLAYEKRDRRYKRQPDGSRRSEWKPRQIMFASHRDACILSIYSTWLDERLEEYYVSTGLSESVLAYRGIGKANYDFAAEVYAFARAHSPVVILAFDVTGFFDNLDHSLLKSRLKRLLGVSGLPEDWYKVFRFATRHHSVDLDALKQHPVFGERFARNRQGPIATIAELKQHGVPICPNGTPGRGIPQGTPISAALSNAYMVDFDAAAQACCEARGGLYRRYSDDILVICPPKEAEALESEITALIGGERLELNPSKTERTRFDIETRRGDGDALAQYLGFTFDHDGARLRSSSLARQWRKLKRSLRRLRKAVEKSRATGGTPKVYTKRLRRRFTMPQFRSFGSYGRRSARAFGRHAKMKRQLQRLERAADKGIRELQRQISDG